MDRSELWKFLATITRHKAFKYSERERAVKRGGGKVVAASDLANDTDGNFVLASLENVRTEDFDIACEELLGLLDEETQRTVLMKLRNHQNQEIASLLRCSVRKVERKLRLARMIWKRTLT